MSRPLRARELKPYGWCVTDVYTLSRPLRARELKPGLHVRRQAVRRRAPCGRVN